VVTAVCVSVCLSVCLSLAAFPNYCTDPDVTWRNGRGFFQLCTIWRTLQLLHEFRCYVSKCLYLRCAWPIYLYSSECTYYLVSVYIVYKLLHVVFTLFLVKFVKFSFTSGCLNLVKKNFRKWCVIFWRLNAGCFIRRGYGSSSLGSILKVHLITNDVAYAKFTPPTTTLRNC